MPNARTAGSLRPLLEERGTYVIEANAKTGWFAVFPKTWTKRMEMAKSRGREGPDLVFHRTISNDSRDHYLIPFQVIRELLTEETLTTSRVNGTRRWNLTLKNGKLHVSHRRGSIDVSRYYGLPLLGKTSVFPKASSFQLGRSLKKDIVRAVSAHGAGFGDPDSNREIERAAVHLVSDHYRSNGWNVESVELQNRGYDLLCRRESDEAHVEVKGVAGLGRRFIITAGELRAAQEDSCYVLALVTAAISSKPRLECIPGEAFLQSFKCSPIAYWAIPSRSDEMADARSDTSQ